MAGIECITRWIFGIANGSADAGEIYCVWVCANILVLWAYAERIPTERMEVEYLIMQQKFYTSTFERKGSG